MSFPVNSQRGLKKGDLLNVPTQVRQPNARTNLNNRILIYRHGELTALPAILAIEGEDKKNPFSD